MRSPTARPDGVFHGAVMARREQETDADAIDAGADLVGRQFEIDAGGFQYVGTAAGAGDGAVAVLGDAAAGGRDDEGRRRGYVERVGAVAAGAAGIDQVRPVADRNRGGE